MLQCTDTFNPEYWVSWNKPKLHVIMQRHLQPWVEGVLKQAKPSCYNVQKPSTLSTGCPETSQSFMLQCTDPFNPDHRVSWNKANLHVTMHRHLQHSVQGALKQANLHVTMHRPFNSQYRVSGNKTNLHVTMHRPLQLPIQGVLTQDKPSCYNVQTPSTLSTWCSETNQTFML